MEDEIVVGIEVGANVRQLESAKKGPKRKVIRAESENTQNHVGEMLTIIPEKAEEVVFLQRTKRNRQSLQSKSGQILAVRVVNSAPQRAAGATG